MLMLVEFEDRADLQHEADQAMLLVPKLRSRYAGKTGNEVREGRAVK